MFRGYSSPVLESKICIPPFSKRHAPAPLSDPQKPELTSLSLMYLGFDPVSDPPDIPAMSVVVSAQKHTCIHLGFAPEGTTLPEACVPVFKL